MPPEALAPSSMHIRSLPRWPNETLCAASDLVPAEYLGCIRWAEVVFTDGLGGRVLVRTEGSVTGNLKPHGFPAATASNERKRRSSMKVRIIFHGVAILVLVATVASAQSPKKPAKSAPASQSADRESSAPSVSEVTAGSAQTTDRKSGSVIVLDREAASGQASGREASSGMATGRRQHEPVLAADKSLGSAHATESLTAVTQADKAKGGQMENASTNPLYKPSQNSGSNPLYQSKDKQAAAASGGTHDVVEYKDPEDMTTRYRPGNNKTSKIKPSTTAAPNK